MYLYDVDKRDFLSNLWPALRRHYRLTCAHIKTEEGFSGCVYEFECPGSVCPHKVAAGGTWGSFLTAFVTRTTELFLGAWLLLRARKR